MAGVLVGHPAVGRGANAPCYAMHLVSHRIFRIGLNSLYALQFRSRVRTGPRGRGVSRTRQSPKYASVRKFNYSVINVFIVNARNNLCYACTVETCHYMVQNIVKTVDFFFGRLRALFQICIVMCRAPLKVFVQSPLYFLFSPHTQKSTIKIVC